MLSFFRRDVLDEIWRLIESVSEGFPTYFYVTRLDFTESASFHFFDVFLAFRSSSFRIYQNMLRIGTTKTINFPFVPNGNLMVFRCPNI